MPKLKNYTDNFFIANDNQYQYKFINDIGNLSYIKNRVDRLFNKEPETIAWINSMNQSAIFYDIGANIGLYTIYAAVKRQCSTYSFEPHAANFKSVIENVEANKLKNSYAYPVAINKNFGLSSMAVKNLYAGVADNVVDSSSEIYHGVVSISLDDVVGKNILPQPDYIKVDVDGFERNVFEGSQQVFKNAKSILIEIDQKDIQLVDDIKNLGFLLESEHVRNSVEKNYIFTAV
jgi:FkbM family methyltransferase